MKERDGKKTCHANGMQNKVGITILIWDKTNCKTKTVTRDKEEHYMMIKVSIQEENLTIIYAPNIGAPKYDKY